MKGACCEPSCVNDLAVGTEFALKKLDVFDEGMSDFVTVGY